MTPFVYSSIFLLVFLQSSANGEAWIGPKRIGVKSYFISSSRGNESVFDTCANKGWRLATIHEGSEQRAIVELAESVPRKKNVCFGLRIFKNSTLIPNGVWSDGTRFDNDRSYRNWYQDEPKTYKKSGRKLIGVRMLARRNWQWDDYSSVRQCRIACEEVATPTITTLEYPSKNAITVEARVIATTATPTQTLLNVTLVKARTNATTVPPTTTPATTTLVEASTNATTVPPTTTPATTTLVQTSTNATTVPPTTTADTTLPEASTNATTVAPTTTPATTTLVQASTNATTLLPTTTPANTTLPEASTNATTVAPTTTPGTTTLVQASTNATTLLPTTTPANTTLPEASTNVTTAPITTTPTDNTLVEANTNATTVPLNTTLAETSTNATTVTPTTVPANTTLLEASTNPTTFPATTSPANTTLSEASTNSTTVPPTPTNNTLVEASTNATTVRPMTTVANTTLPEASTNATTVRPMTTVANTAPPEASTNATTVRPVTTVANTTLLQASTNATTVPPTTTPANTTLVKAFTNATGAVNNTVAASYVQQAGNKLVSDLSVMESTPENVQTVANTLNSLLDAGQEAFAANPELSREILKSIDKFLNKYDVEKYGDFSSSTDNLDISIRRIEKGTAVNETSDADDSIALILSAEFIQEAFDRKSNQSTSSFRPSLQLNSALYKNPSLFQVNQTAYGEVFIDELNHHRNAKIIAEPTFGDLPTTQLAPVVISEAVSVEMKNLTVSGMQNPLRIEKSIGQQPFSAPELLDMKAVKSTPVCAFWDATTDDWSTVGCTTKLETDMGTEQTILECECDHMTSFAVVLTTSYIYAPQYLDGLTIAGCSISIPCLLAAIFTIVYFKQLRTQTAQQIILHICFNLFALNVIFLVGIDRPADKDYKLCMVSSVALHYFLLTAWAWMLLEGIFLFLSIVIPFHRREIRGKIITIGTGIAYGVPALVVGLTAGLTRDYLSEKYCWLSMATLLPALAYPVALILFVNLVIFCAVLYVITCKSKMFRDKLDAAKVRLAAKRAICMIFILGIPWIFGFLMLLSQNSAAKEAFAICFTVFNTTQGMALFIAFCARQEQVRDLWKTLFEKNCAGVARRVRSYRRRRTGDGGSPQKSEESRATKATALNVTTLSRDSPGPSPVTLAKMPHRSGWTEEK